MNDTEQQLERTPKKTLTRHENVVNFYYAQFYPFFKLKLFIRM